MGVVIPVGFAQTVIEIQLAGKPTPFGVTLGIDPPPLFTPAAIAEAVYESLIQSGSMFSATPSEAWSQDYTLVGVHATLMDASGPLLGDFTDPRSGDVVTQVTPPNTAILVRKGTASGGRQGRGRSYWPNVWWAETGISNAGIIESAVLVQIQARLNVWMDELGERNMTPVLLHSSAELPPYPITSMQVQSLVATQRRRLRS